MTLPSISKNVNWNKNNYETNKVIAEGYLHQAISNRYSEKPMREYIKFMDSLDKETRDKILLDKEITKLIDKINRYSLP
jgi:hypothetical protein